MSNPRRPRILIVGAQHGDERLGPRLQRLLRADQTGRYATVDYVCGNPRAYRRNVRYTETDLNRSYATLPAVTYEQKRAQKILRMIRQGAYDYVLDIHTSRADVGRFLLAAQLDGPVRDVLAASGFERLAIMPPHIADCSLIGQVTQAVSIEYDRRLASTKRTLQELTTLLDNLLSHRFVQKPREVFYVSGKIPLQSTLDYDAKNFELSEQGFYPVIFSRNSSYTEYRGFAAHRRDVIVA